MIDLEAASRIADTLDVPLEYLLAGPDDAPAVVLVHSLGASCRQYFPHVETLARSHRVLCPSLRGHGRSGRPSPGAAVYSLARFADDVVRLAESLGIRRFHYVGNSMGGTIGYEIARCRPDALLSLTTFGAPARVALPVWVMRGYGSLVGAAVRTLGPRRFDALAAAGGCATDEGRARLGEVLAGHPAYEAMPHALSSLERIDYLDVIDRADFPVLILRADADFLFNRLQISLFSAATRNPRVRIEPLEGAGHVANLDRPEAFERAITRFLAQSAESHGRG